MARASLHEEVFCQGEICQRLAQEISWNRGWPDAGGGRCHLKEKSSTCQFLKKRFWR